MRVDIMIILCICCLCLTMYWLLLSCVFVYICFACLCYMTTLFLHDAYLVVMFICDINMLITSIDSLAMIALLTLTCLFSFVSMWLILFIVYYFVHLNRLSIFVVYSSCLSYFLSLFLDLNDIPTLCMTVCCMTTLLLLDACISCQCGTHMCPFISNPLVSINHVSLDLIFGMRLVALFALWSSWWFEVGSSDGLYLCLGAFWRRPTHWSWLESDHWTCIA